MSENQPHKVVIVGGGFAGLFAAKSLKDRRNVQKFDVTLLDKRNFHLFQPLLYQVATGSLVVGDIATPHRVVLQRRRNVTPLTGTAYDLDIENRRVLHEHGALNYDTLIVSTGVKHHYFGNDHWRPYAPGLKTVEHALEMRRRIFTAFERAEQAESEVERRRQLTFVVVGAGPTGVELAGALGELAHRTLVKDFRHIDPREARILLIEGADNVLPPYSDKLRDKARQMLEELGVTVIVNTLVQDVQEHRVQMKGPEGEQTIDAATVLWAAGVRASAFGEVLAERTGVELDRGGKVHVQPDLSLPGHPEIFVVGDLAHCEQADGTIVPGLAPAAIQQGRYVAKQLRDRAAGKQIKPFKYKDKGSMAVIGRNRAIGDLGWMRISGFPAWLLWVGVHIWSLIDPEQRLHVMIQWIWKYFSRRQGSRLITGDPPKTASLRGR